MSKGLLDAPGLVVAVDAAFISFLFGVSVVGFGLALLSLTRLRARLRLASEEPGGSREMDPLPAAGAAPAPAARHAP